MLTTVSIPLTETRHFSSSNPANLLRKTYRSNPSSATSRLDASYEAGVITISGVVPTYYAHQMALTIAKKHVTDSSIVIRDRIRVRGTE